MFLDFTAYYDGDDGAKHVTMQDWDDITNELKQFGWPDDIKEE